MFPEGEVHQILKRCLNLIWEHGYSASIILPDGKAELKPNPMGLFEFIREYEEEKGLAALLDLLLKCLRIVIADDKARRFEIRLVMGAPEESKERKALFKDVICSWVEKDELSFSQRFFRFPKVSEDFLGRFLENSLEIVLRKTFGFHFKYKIIVRCQNEAAELEPMRKSLYKILYNSGVN